jgi:hypothetical protein
MNPRRGFADDSMVLIHGEYYRTSDTANEKRRPILMLAWYTEFADILLSNASLGLTAQSYQNLKQKGATDIVKGLAVYLKQSLSVFTQFQPHISRDQAEQNRDYFLSALYDLKEKRNYGIHEKIGHSLYLEEILKQMIDFCQLLKNIGMANYQSNMFADECVRQLRNLKNFRHLY